MRFSVYTSELRPYVPVLEVKFRNVAILGRTIPFGEHRHTNMAVGIYQDHVRFFCKNWWLLKEPFCLFLKCSNLRFLFGLLGQEDGLDVGQNTTLCDCNTGQQFVQLFVVSYGQL